MNNITFILDSGHGGVVGSKYTTSPLFDKNDPSTWVKSFYHKSEDITFFEGVFNRDVITIVKNIMDVRGMEYLDATTGDKTVSQYDISLPKRVGIANEHYKTNKNCMYFSMHGNAFNGKAHGIEIFTSIGQTKSDSMATSIFNSIVDFFPNEKYRKDTWSDGDVDKEVNYYVLRKTLMPSVLLEFLFFDNLIDCKKMLDVKVQHRLAKAIVNGFEEIQKNANKT